MLCHLLCLKCSGRLAEGLRLRVGPTLAGPCLGDGTPVSAALLGLGTMGSHSASLNWALLMPSSSLTPTNAGLRTRPPGGGD